MADLPQVVDQYLKALADRDVDRALGFYADHAVIVSFEGVAEGAEQIRSFLAGFIGAYDRYDLVSIDQLRAAHDLIVWEATMETGAGLMQVTNVVTLDDDGLILRHVRSVRGYWGKT
jgi:ketosteroid isomerase-like protein